MLLTDVDRTGGGNAEDRLEEGRGIRTQDAHSLEPVFLQIERKAPGAISRFQICPTEDLVVCRNVVDSLGLSPLQGSISPPSTTESKKPRNMQNNPVQ